MIDQTNFLVRLEVNVDGNVEKIAISGFTVIPGVNDEIELDTWNGRKMVFRVDNVKHHISNIGHDMLQQVTIRGTAIS